MPRSLAELDVIVTQLQAENARQQEQIKALQAVVGVGTAPAPAVSLQKIAAALEPLSQHAGRILAVQAGALGVRQ